MRYAGRRVWRRGLCRCACSLLAGTLCACGGDSVGSRVTGVMHTLLGASAVNPSSISLGYTCGTVFRIRNANWAAATLTYLVQQTGEQGSVTVPSRPQAYPYNETYLQTSTTGTVQLSYAGTMIGAVVNAGT